MPDDKPPRVGIVMGSDSDWPKIKAVAVALREFDVAHEIHVMSAHRTPGVVEEFATSAIDRGIRVIIAAAGGAAHLAGVVAAQTHLPVLGCPMKGWSLDGLDSLLSMVQMPKGIPVATLAIGKAGAINAGLLAAAILALSDDGIRERLLAYRREQSERVDKVPQA